MSDVDIGCRLSDVGVGFSTVLGGLFISLSLCLSVSFIQFFERIPSFPLSFLIFFIMTGGGTTTIGYRVASSNSLAVLGILAGLNVWDDVLSGEEILRMSYGCGEEAGNVKAWSMVTKGIQGKIKKKPASCKDRKG